MVERKVHNVGIIMNGVTGRMGTNQHLIRSICAIRTEGGIKLPNGDVIMPDPVLVGRNAVKLDDLCIAHGITRSTTDLDSCLDDPYNSIYFDAQTTGRRAEALKKAIAKGKHVYCEKPIAVSSAEAYELYRLAQEAGVKNGVVQDKLWLPGLIKLKTLLDSGFFGEVLSVRGEFGYWVFDGTSGVLPQRPSWNYRKEDDGGIISDMICHWQYVIQNLFGDIDSLTCKGATHIKERVDENGNLYKCTADDAAYATFELSNGVVAHFNSSWAVRVRRDDLLTIQVDGTKGSAVAGLRDCVAQHESQTVRSTWNPDVDTNIKYMDHWSRVPDYQVFDNAFKVQWEMFLRHVINNEPWKYDLLQGAKGVQLTELAQESWAKRMWVDVPSLE
ncbi:oxidoreductase family, NAD-binding rossmann fold domain-containing protein [Pochonia chlamydosporia 170]|uniref:Oxidoreductase family, NAD-binding rossmann fold domain-containing protein n=1 Tax=Pochonia chlamydosporia 170 TaxID=1380566 RepID=A0A179FEG7_METCM|nr:oxidoreductase family, NAD-binding rossmann fold domain-containing protein [Pochonia chlamydosporia 170]OAQ63700.1 oxidoreductase family, NAD-binding rossmann fold domain-containing protein [Pochonia chlamydosporia 170]